MKRYYIALIVIFTLVTMAAAQVPAIAFCRLDHDLDFKTVKAGDRVDLRLSRDLTYGDVVILPAGTPVTAKVVDAKDSNTVSLAVDRAKTKAGKEVELMGIIAAIATPKDDLTSDPLYGMNHSAEVSQHSYPGTGLDPQAGVATSGAAAQTAIMRGANDPKSNLTADSQGAIGISGLSLTWILDKPPALTVLTSKKKNFKLKSGTELLLRLAPPKI